MISALATVPALDEARVVRGAARQAPHSGSVGKHWKRETDKSGAAPHQDLPRQVAGRAASAAAAEFEKGA